MTRLLSDIIRIPDSFTRSIQIEKDLKKPLDSKQYLVTPVFRQLVHRIVLGANSPGGNRAWTIIGSYGSGKSAAALALVQLLTGQSPDLLLQIHNEDSSLYEEITKWGTSNGTCLPVLLSGHRGPLTPSVYQAIITAAQDHGDLSDDFWDEVKRCNQTDSRSVGELFGRLAAETAVVLIIDELGKFLEFAAHHPAEGDVFLLQTLAETAARSRSNPAIVITILHQAADRYGSYLVAAQRAELAKIQGRYEEIPFIQPVDQILKLIGLSIKKTGPGDELEWINKAARTSALGAWDLGLAPLGMDQTVFCRLLCDCAPLHPITALLLGPLFRKLAQNERSLFSFLSSEEPYSFRWFLSRTGYQDDSVGFYTPDYLYDYLSHSFGTSLFAGHHGGHWARIEAALDRLKDPTVLQVRIVKFIGLMGVIGEVGELRPSKDILRLLYDGSDLDQAMEALATESVLVFRRFLNSYRLWEGSDLNLDERLVEASKQVSDSLSLTELLSELPEKRPEIARRHFFVSGTMRFFSVKYIAEQELPTLTPASHATDADGQIFFIFTSDEERAAAAISKAAQDLAKSDIPIILASVKTPGLLHSAVLEYKRLLWVQDNTPELANDPVAFRELTSRLFETQQILEKALEVSWIDVSMWFAGRRFTLKDRRSVNGFLSDVLDRMYDKAPKIRNELINRRQPSSSAVSARRQLLELMITFEQTEDLGIEGYPPCKSMYLSTLRVTGVHRQIDDQSWAFVKPTSDSDLYPVWQLWNRFLESSVSKRKSIADFWEQLRKPPFGVRDGIIPILLCAMLLESRDDVALYEAGSFVPTLDVSIMERLSKNPEKFEIRYCPIDDLKGGVFAELRRAGLVHGTQDQVLSVVKPLVQFAAKLPEYTKATKSLSARAQAVRYHLLTAREPETLLFESLPRALGFPSFLENDTDLRRHAPDFAAALQEVRMEIGLAYPHLLDEIRQALCDSLLVPGDSSEIRSFISERATRLSRLSISDLRLRAFVMRLADSSLEEQSWLESLGAFIVGKPPAAWKDEDRERYGIELGIISRRFVAFEAIQLESLRKAGLTPGSVEIGRIELTTSTGQGRQGFYSVPGHMQAKVQETAKRILDVIRQDEDFSGDAIVLAVLAEVIDRLVSSQSGEEAERV